MFPNARSAIVRFGLGIALLLGALGTAITFYPGAEMRWFGLAGVLAALGLLSPNWGARGLATVLVVWFVWCAWQGHQRGQQYQEWLSQQKPLLQQLRQPAVADE